MAKVKAKPKKAKGLVGKTTNVGVCATWLLAFQNKAIKTAEQVSKFMKSEFAGRDSKIFDYPNVVVARANRGLLDSEKHNFKKYPLDKAKAQS